ncbi:MAG: PQQ-dependent dehydrogenase, methanol/ethanol family [Gammaproteobacteria bacterium]|nr:PQQ-dependent dehydrogenase, methanol/ethanol family [Gammaproteobacteria bacterium]
MRTRIVFFTLCLLLSACERNEPQPGSAAIVTDARLVNADAEPHNWLNHGRTYNEQRFSPLTQINDGNVAQLKLAWHLDLPGKRGLEATPLVADGRMYTTGTWSRVYAVDAASGEMLWEYDPQVPPQKGIDACCDVVNRGVALWRDRVYVGTLDGRLIALDAMSGKEVWSVQTTPSERRYTITGAPRVVNGKVLIGNGGAEFDARGYVTAYDAATGEQLWRFYTVPGDPSLPFENPILKQAATTWTGEWWQYGGGGTVWDAITYDPELNLVYLGVGNGTPWNRRVRSPGGGDNLFLASIVAVNANTGAYVWHYQTAPGDTWDFTATQHIMLADLELNGEARKVLMQAPKNGFFYVIDRTDGELLSAEPFVEVNWATHIDMRTGRPVETPNARYQDGEFASSPAAPGGHNWHPMAYHPGAGLVYIPAQDLPWVYKEVEQFEFSKVTTNSGLDPIIASMPEDPTIQEEISKLLKGYLLAWDPREQKARWTVELPIAWNGGALATAGNLVFQGASHGEFIAYAADTGARLWAHDVQTAALAGPVTYQVDGKQYVAVMTGYGTAFGIESGIVAKWAGVRALNRIVAYTLDGTAELPPLAPLPEPPAPPAHRADAQTVALGKLRYHQYCSRCHGDAGISAGVLPDLRHLDADTHALWDAIVRGGSRLDQGMPGFAAHLQKTDTDAIHAYVIKRAHDPEYMPAKQEPRK